MKKVLILSDGRAGHFNQSLAVSEAIRSVEPIEEIFVEVKVRKFGKYILRVLLNSMIGRALFKGRISLKIIDLFYEGYSCTDQPDIVISSGKDTSLLNAMLGLMYGSKNFFIGNPKKLDQHLFTAVLTILDKGFHNQIVLNVAPTRAYKGDLNAFMKTYDLNSQDKYATLLIGGNGAGYEYHEEDIEELIAFVNATSDEMKWLVTTSRRTPEAYEEKMEKEMTTECFIAFNKNPQKVVAGFLEMSSIVFVTEESASMISEGVASKKPVIALAPKNYSVDADYQNILKKFTSSKRIKRVEIERLRNFEIDLTSFEPIKLDSSKEIAEKIKELL